MTWGISPESTGSHKGRDTPTAHMPGKTTELDQRLYKLLTLTLSLALNLNPIPQTLKP